MSAVILCLTRAEKWVGGYRKCQVGKQHLPDCGFTDLHQRSWSWCCWEAWRGFLVLLIISTAGVEHKVLSQLLLPPPCSGRAGQLWLLSGHFQGCGGCCVLHCTGRSLEMATCTLSSLNILQSRE